MTNQHIGLNIKKRRETLGITQEELAKKMGYKSRSTINKIEAGINDVSNSKIQKFADALETSALYLMGLSDNERQNIENIIPMPETMEIPLVGTIACGTPILAEENISEYVPSPCYSKADFALRCQGDSMINARIYDGDIVYIRKQSTVDNGEIAAVLVGEEATLKRVYIYPNKIVLNPENPIYEPMVYTNEELNNVQILGKAVYFTSRIH